MINIKIKANASLASLEELAEQDSGMTGCHDSHTQQTIALSNETTQRETGA